MSGAMRPANTPISPSVSTISSCAGAPPDEAVVGGTGLSLLATTRDLRAGGLPDDATIRIDLGEARLLDLAGFSDLLPPRRGWSSPAAGAKSVASSKPRSVRARPAPRAAR